MSEHVDRTILLVEDEVIVALAHERLLRKHGYSVLRANSGEAAIEVARAGETIDLVLMDIDLGPGIDGIDAAVEILASQSLPVVFLTGHSEQVLVDRVKDITRYGYVLKSAGEFMLLESINMAFELFNANRELRRSRDHYRSVVTLSGEIIVRHAADQRWVFVNKTACEFWGKSKSDLLDDGYLSFVHPDDLEATLAAWSTMKDDLQPVWGFINRQLTPKGWRSVEWNSAPLLDRAGHFVGHQATGRDVTERLNDAERNTDNPLHRALHQFRTVFDSAPMGIILADSENRVVEANAAAQRLLGFAAGELIGRSGRDLIHPDDLAEAPIEQVTESVVGAGAQPSIEHRFVRKDGSHVEVSAWIGRVELPGSHVSHMIQFHDISARKRAERRVETLLAEKEILLREVHHRVKNNLAVVAAMLGQQSQDSPDAARPDALLEAAARIRTMQSLYERTFESEDYSEVALAPYLEELIREAHGTIGMAGRVTLETDIENCRIPFNIGFPLGIIANELITNAAKHAFPSDRTNDSSADAPERRVSIAVRRLDDSIEMQYRDNGVGVPEDVIDGSSRGFGLTLIDLLSQQFDGEYRVRRDNGTEVTVVLQCPPAS